MKKALQFLRKNPEIIFFICAFILWTVFMCYENAMEGGDFRWHDIKVEANGMIFDLFVFGILVTAYNAIRARKEKIERLQEEIDDYREWNQKEAMFRVVGAIKRLNQLGVSKIDLSDCFLKKANLRSRNLIGANLFNARLQGADLSFANLCDAILSGADLEKAHLAKANLANARIEEAYLKGAALNRANLRGVDFHRSDLEDAVLDFADLSNTKWYKSNLKDAKFLGADLRGADLEGAIVADKTGEEWFEQLERWETKGIEGIKKKYKVDEFGSLQLK